MTGADRPPVVERSGDTFELTWADDTHLEVSTPLELDASSAHHKFSIMGFARKGLREEAIAEVHLKSQDPSRIGWLIPANALSSTEHSHARNVHFLKYAHAAIVGVLGSHSDLYTTAATEARASGRTRVPFADLFHENVCFLVVCTDLVDGIYDVDRLVPSLVSKGYVPLEACNPEALSWGVSGADEPGHRLSIMPTSPHVASRVTARLVTTAASSSGTTAEQFFYLYQVIELLLEEILAAVLPPLGTRVAEAIRDGRYLALRDELDGLGAHLSEKARLKMMVQAFAGGENAIRDFVATSEGVLVELGVEPKGGIASIYQLRNFIVHQVRNLSANAEARLPQVISEFTAVLPIILGTFDTGRAVPSRSTPI